MSMPGEVEAPSPICTLAVKVGEAPLVSAVEQIISIAVLEAELRGVVPADPMLPVCRSEAILGRNWLRVVASSLTRMRRAPGRAVVVREAHHDVQVVALVDHLLGVDEVEAAEVRARRVGVVGQARLGVDRTVVLRRDEVEAADVGRSGGRDGAPKTPAPRPSASMFMRMLAGPWPPDGCSHTWTTRPLGAMAMSPKLQPLGRGAVCRA